MVNSTTEQLFVTLKGCRVGSSVLRAKSWNTSPSTVPSWMYMLQFHACSLLQSVTLFSSYWSDTSQTITIVVYIVAVTRTSLVQPNKHARVQKSHFSKKISISTFLLTLLECYFSKLLSGEPKAMNYILWLVCVLHGQLLSSSHTSFWYMLDLFSKICMTVTCWNLWSNLYVPW